MPAPLSDRRAPRLLLTTDAVGGVWTYSLDLARGLSEAGVEVLLAVLGPSPAPDQLAAAARIAGLSVADTGLPLDWTAADPGELMETAAALRGAARGARVDLAHLNSPTLALGGGWPVPALGACHSCLATWWAAVKDGPMPPDFVWRTEALRRGLADCDELVAPSAAFARATAEAHEVRTPRVVRNGRAGASAGEGPTAPFVFTAGRLWDEGKNVRVLDAAAAEVAASVWAAGPLAGPSGARVELRHARALGALPADAVRTWLARRPIYAASALYEPFGLGVLEAAQAGCPLVLSDIPTLRELWDGAAVFVDPADAAGWTAALSVLLRDPARREALGAAARARAARYTAARMTAGLLALYAELSPAFAKPPVGEAAA
jgi:glycosyltransferase involved in cell wall biosynthesis